MADFHKQQLLNTCVIVEHLRSISPVMMTGVPVTIYLNIECLAHKIFQLQILENSM